MTITELEKARQKYYTEVEGKKLMLNYLKNYQVKQFLTSYFSNVDENNIQSILDDEILRNAFLSTFYGTKESSNLMVYINRIHQVYGSVCEEKTSLESVAWEKAKDGIPKESNAKWLYCDLETNQPYLIQSENVSNFCSKNQIIELPEYQPKTESYVYKSTNVRITKGSATESFNRLQLYYFKLLLDKKNTKEMAITRIKCLTPQEYKRICSK